MRYFFGLILIVFIFILGVLLLFGGHKKPTTPHVRTLPEYASTEAEVIFTKDGTINGDDAHRAIRITVSQNQRQLEIVQGYSNHVIESHSQYNTENAFSIFLKAINNSGFLLERKGVKPGLDYTAICPLQNRYSFTLRQGDNLISQLWTSDCGISSGNFGGLFDTVQALFQDQITGYRDLTSKVIINQ